MVQTIEITLLEERDKAQVRQVLIEGYTQYKASYKDEADWLEYLQAIEHSLENPVLDRVLVAKEGEKVLGSLQIYLDAATAYAGAELDFKAPIVRLLVVHPDARGKGIAQKLLEESFAYAKSLQAPKLYLHTSDMMAAAIKLYEKLGFKRDYTKEFYKKDILVKCYAYDIQ